MDKLVERESAPRARPLATAPALAVQFFLIPLAVVAVVVVIYAGFRMLLADERTAQDFLWELSTTRGERRWPAAYELARLMANPAVEAQDAGLGPALVRAFAGARDDDPRVRRYLALAIGRLQAPPAGAVPALLEALGDADAETRITVVWALGALGDPVAVPALQGAFRSDDPGIRKVVVYALGALPGDTQEPALVAALTDPAPDVQWNAAVALAHRGRAEGLPVLQQMLDRQYVESVVTREAGEMRGGDRVAEVMIAGLQAAGTLRSAALRDPVAAISRHDDSLKVRQAALEALKRWTDEPS